MEGTFAGLHARVADVVDGPATYRWAEGVASGAGAEELARIVPMAAGLDASGAMGRGALAHGFGWVLLYGGASVWVLAGMSFVVFRGGKAEVVRDGEAAGMKAVCTEGE